MRDRIGATRIRSFGGENTPGPPGPYPATPPGHHRCLPPLQPPRARTGCNGRPPQTVTCPVHKKLSTFEVHDTLEARARRAQEGRPLMTLQDQVHEDPGREHPKLVRVEITIGDKTRPREVRAGRTGVSELKVELGVPAEDSLFETAPQRRPLADPEVIDVVGGEKFEAVHGGGVS
jgi:hypothetical protein